MIKALAKLIFAVFFTAVFAANCFAATEPYENFIKGSLKVNDTLVVKDEKFRNPLFNWAEISNITVQNTVYLRVIDEQQISRDFSCRVKIKIEYFQQPNQVSPTVIDSTTLFVNYKKQGGSVYNGLATYTFKDGYRVKVTVLDLSSPEFGNQLPPVFQLGSNILIERKYAFKPFLFINLDGQTEKSGGNLQRGVNAGSGITGNYLSLSWQAILGSEEFDLEWVSIDEDSEWATLATSMKNGNSSLSNDELAELFRNNATRITTAGHDYRISLLFNAKYIAARIRQVQYTTDGFRLEGDWFYKKDNSEEYAIWDLNWHEQNLNWQYSASYAEEGKKKEVVSYFDGSLRGRQTVTLNTSDSVAVVQENIYDEFGRAAMSILPAPIKESVLASLHYFPALNKNLNGKPYSFIDLDTTLCEPLPGPLSTLSGTSRYYSPQNDFRSLKLYNNYIPDALGYPLSVTQYTPDNTGRIKIQGGVGRTFQPDASVNSHTTKYYYGKPEQWELDRLFGNDVGYAEHYLKNMVMDPNGQLSISYLNASGKTIATALAGDNPHNLDSLALNSKNSIDELQTSQLLKPEQFNFDASSLKLKATTTYMATMNGAGMLKYNIQKLISRYPNTSFKPCSNCYYDLTIQVKNDCDTPVYFNRTPIKIGSMLADSTNTGLHTDSIQVNFQKIGAYYVTFEFALSKNVIENFTDEYIRLGQINGAVKRKEDFILKQLDSARFIDCFSDCKTALERLGTRSEFTAMFNEQMRLLGDTTSYYDAYINGLYDNLLSSATAFHNNCDNLQPSPCDTYRTAMLADINPGGQFALFDAAGNVMEPASNLLFTFFRHGAFDVLTNTSDPLRLATLVNKEDGSGTFSPYDADFTLADLLKYWQPAWAEQFLTFHPEYCKLKFCNDNSASVKWDAKIEEITSVTELAQKMGITYNRNTISWLANADPFFNAGGAGSSFKTNFVTDLTEYSIRILGANDLSVKNISGFVDFQLYCADTTASTNNIYKGLWNNCSPVEDCRVADREWNLYKGMYLEAKLRYFNELRQQRCAQSNSCTIGEPIAIVPVPQTPSDCIYDGPTVNSDKNIALQKLANVLDTDGSGAVEMWLYSTNYTSRQFIAATPDVKYMMQACFNGSRVSVDIFHLKQTAPDNVGIVLSNHITADISDLLPIKPWMHLAVQGLNSANGELELWINGKQYAGIPEASSAGCPWGITSNPLNLPENLSSIHHLRLYSGRNMTPDEIRTNAASACFLASDHTAMDWYRFNAGNTEQPPTCATLSFFYEAEQLSTNQFRETNYAIGTRKTHTFISGNASVPPDASPYCANGTVQMVFRPCINVLFSSVPTQFNNVWQITCTENFNVDCSGNGSAILYAESGSGSVYYQNTVGNISDVHRVISGYAENDPPPLDCNTGNSYQIYYNCLVVSLPNTSAVITFDNVWVNTCLGEYNGTVQFRSAGKTTNASMAVQPVSSVMQQAIRMNVDLSMVKPEDALAELEASKQDNQLILADYKTKFIYAITKAAPEKATAAKGQAVKAELFDAAELKPYFAVEGTKGSYSIFRNVYVAKYIPQENSIKAREAQTLLSIYGGGGTASVQGKSMRSAMLAESSSPNVNSLTAPSVCVTLLDEFYGPVPSACTYQNDAPDQMYQTTIALKDSNGQPASLLQDVTVRVKYTVRVFGLPVETTTNSVDITIPAGQTIAHYLYNLKTSTNNDESNICNVETRTLECIESISGASFCSETTSCAGTVLNPPINPNPANCPDYLKTKFSHFPEAAAVDPNALNVDSMVAEGRVLQAQQYEDAAEGQSQQWMTNLAEGLKNYSADTTALLRSKLKELCLLASDSTHIYGATTLPPGKFILVGNTSCRTFGEVIKAVTGISDFTPTLNPWLISGPYPYEVVPQQTEVVISATNTELCTMLANLNPNHLGQADFYALLQSQFGQRMTLSPEEVGFLLKGCDNCKFLLEKDLVLPQFLIPGFKGCVSKDELGIAYTELIAAFGPQFSQTMDNAETIVTNYFNQKWGFTLSFDDYRNFGESTQTQLCNLPPYTEAAEDRYACAKTLIERAHGDGSREYLDYLTEARRTFQESYISICAAARAEVSVSSRQKIFHYTLYYYDLAGNLVRTIPPEGVHFLNTNELATVAKVRAAGNISCNYNGPNTVSDEDAALQKLSTVLSSTASNAVEMWLYSDFSGSRQFIAATPDLKYMVQACQNGKYLNVEIFSLSQSASGNMVINLTNQVTADVSNILPLAPWTHLVVQGNNLSTGALQIFVNGKAYNPVGGKPVAGCPWAIDAMPLRMPRNFTAMKHLRLYENRLMSAAEIKANAENTCFMVSDTTALSWYRYNVPQEGGPTTIAYNSTQESQVAGIYPEHGLPTTYAYNATNQVVQQYTPDGGSSKFWYDYLSRLVVSQNAKQEAAKDYSYTRYDVLGRITEVGQKHTGTNVLTDPGYLAGTTITNFQASGNNSQLTETLYDEAAPAINGTPSGLVQNNLRKRVAASIYRETPNSAAINASYYSYDMAGNVKKLYQQVNGLGLKTLDYEYDLVSGKVNLLAYQHDKPDAFYYQYKYDAENRLTEAWSSTQANIVSYGFGSSLNDPTRRLDASYQYYLHGPLARMELGPGLALVQGMDYAYTLQGWLKGVNGTHLDGAQSDMGQDGTVVAKDALGYSLGYYAGDYQPIGGSSASAFASTYQQNLGDITGKNLYNGNIGNSTYAIAKIKNGATVGYTYKYDQLNRLKALRQHGLSGTGIWTSNSLTNNYKEDFSYDGNGNILALMRNDSIGQVMDQLSYRYTKNAAGQLVHNKLAGVNDAVNSGQQGELEGNTSYSYDAIGNLIKDSKEGITNIDWSVYGKIKQINKANGNIQYTYDPSGNRVSKLYNNKTTWYVRDAQGNSLAVYDNANGHYNWKEQQLYGSSRLGMWKPELNIDSAGGASLNSLTGNRNYELANHLGNTMAVISDNRLQTSNGYEADVLHSNDYYAFGAQMPGRMFNLAGSYRYGFNGKENDNEVKGEGNQQDYGMRIYDPRVGRFLSVDPIANQYPELTPYQFASNTPIQAIDLDGLEKYHYSLDFDKKGAASLKLTSTENFSEWTWKPELGNTAFGFQLWEKVKNPYKEYIVSYNTTEYLIIAPVAAKMESTYKLSYDNLPSTSTVLDGLSDKIESTQVKTAIVQGFAGGLSTGRVRNRASKEWEGPLDYSGLKEPRKVGPGMETTPSQRQRILDYNKKMNGGVLRSDEDGSVINMPKSVPKGGKADMKQAEVDHVEERVNGGSNSNRNLRVVSKEQNLKKESQRRKQ
ncbi:RHS repeat domain-containing protein [Pedobacter rhodius]|uniref:DUF6443 domain-containing protein n=1 Tax=Pedobacter rhodius TaxID=3004098 RepID=A0ABT4KXA3_9SPHI|nr:RHS repeat-associated core domain-containing protein [Pedobacter sp. SJ11]MCZ4222508.1 hypothetical protein [Pedobacter sp. SJ11]